MKTFPPIIGLLGFAGSGKDTSAELLQLTMLERADQYSLYALASPLKLFSSNVFELDLYLFNDRIAKEREVKITLDYDPFVSRLIRQTISILNTHYEINGVLFTLDFSIVDVFREVFKEYEVKRNWFQLMIDKFSHVEKITYKISPRKIAQLVGTEFFRDYISKTFWTDICPKENVIVTDVRFPEEYEMIKNNGGVVIKVENSSLVKLSEHAHSSEEFIDKIECDYVINNDGVNMSTLISEVERVSGEIYAQ